MKKLLTLLITSFVFIGCKERTTESILLSQRQNCIDNLYYDRTGYQNEWANQIKRIDSLLILLKNKDTITFKK